MVLVTNKNTGDTIEAAEWNESATAVNKVIQQTLVAADVSDFDTEVSNNTTVVAKLDNVSEDTTPELGGNLDALNQDLRNIRVAEFNTEYDNGTAGATPTIDFTNGNYQKITLGENATFSVTPPSGPTSCQLRIIEGDTYSITWWTITWLTNGGTAPTLDGTDIVSLFYDGTNWYGVVSNQS